MLGYEKQKKGERALAMIMLVTFQEELRDQLVTSLGRKGYDVCVPPHREDVLSMAKEQEPLVVLLDMYISSPSGLDVLQQLRTQGYKGKVVLLGGRSIPSSISEAFRFGVDQVVGGPQWIDEPINLGQIETAIQTVLHSATEARASELYESRGRMQGKDLEDWFEAERQIRHAKTSLPSSKPADMNAEPEKIAKKSIKKKTSP